MGELKDEIIKYRAKKRITQEEMGKLCGLTGQTIMNIENGKSVPNKVSKAKILLVLEGESEE